MLSLKNWLLTIETRSETDHIARGAGHTLEVLHDRARPPGRSAIRARQNERGRRWLAVTGGNGSINWRGRFPWPVRRLNSRSFLTQLPTVLRGNPGHDSFIYSSHVEIVHSPIRVEHSWVWNVVVVLEILKTGDFQFLRVLNLLATRFRGGSTSVTRFDRLLNK